MNTRETSYNRVRSRVAQMHCHARRMLRNPLNMNCITCTTLIYICMIRDGTVEVVSMLEAEHSILERIELVSPPNGKPKEASIWEAFDRLSCSRSCCGP